MQQGFKFTVRVMFRVRVRLSYAQVRVVVSINVDVRVIFLPNLSHFDGPGFDKQPSLTPVNNVVHCPDCGKCMLSCSEK